MKITILTDNFAGAYFFAEHGLSYLIETDNFKLLWDTGATDIFIKNAEKLNINLEDIKTVALSHGHWDHGNGLINLKNKTLITHPNSFIKRFRRSNNEYLGLNLSITEIKQKFNLKTSTKPYEINKNIIFLGEIPRKFEFENWQTPYKDEFKNDDFIIDDTALVIIENNELNIVTGCSHSGICNITEYAKKITGINKINTIIGGFHLKKANEHTFKTVEYFKSQSIKQLLPAHCTQLPALAKFFDEFNIEQIKTGMIINI